MIFLNLKIWFDKIGKAYALYLGARVRKQQDLDGVGYTPVERTIHTKKGSHIRKGKRLVETGRFNQKAFIYEANEGSLIIKGNPEGYGDRGRTYADIIAYNDRESPYLKGKHGATIKAVGPKLFPWTKEEFKESYQKAFGKSITEGLAVEVKNQIQDYLRKEIPKEITLKL